jgi:threonine dehydratase
VSVPTPLEPAPPGLAGRPDVWLKREDVHELGAFKWRGALPTLERWQSDVVTASTGNQGAATAWAAMRIGFRATVFVPEGASPAKLAVLARLGADVRQVGADFDEAKEAAQAFARGRGLPFFDDGAEPTQLEGYAAIADEILAELVPAAVVVPVGNGALLAGVGRRIRTGILRVGVAAKEAPVMVESWRAGRPVESDRSTTIADGLAVRVAIPVAVELLNEAADRMLLVSERSLADATAAFYRVGITVEPAAAAGLAALPQLADVDGPVVLVVTGRNVDEALLRRVLDEPDSFPD